MDGMSVDEFAKFARHHWEWIRSALYKSTNDASTIPTEQDTDSSVAQRPLLLGEVPAGGWFLPGNGFS